MLKKLIILFILSLASVLFAAIEVLEKTDDRIVARVNFIAPIYRDGMEIPFIPLNFTADRGSQPQVSASPQNRHSMRIPENLPSQTISPTVNFTFLRSIPLFSAMISPILSINGNEVIYTTEMIVVIRYSAGQTVNPVPRGSFYDAVSSVIINSERIQNTVATAPRPAPRSSFADFNNFPSNVRTALRFYIGDKPSIRQDSVRFTYRETDIARSAGIYRITRSDLAPLLTSPPQSPIPINQIRIRSSNPNIVNDTTPSITQLTEELNGLVDVPFVFRKRNPSANLSFFEEGDEILFYAEKIHTWRFNERESVNDWQFLFNFTDFRRYYWITIEPSAVSPNRMSQFLQPQEPGAPLQTVGDVYFRLNRTARLTTGDLMQGHGDKRWVWATLNQNTSIQNAEFPREFITNRVDGVEAQIRFFAHESSGFNSLNFSALGVNLEIPRPDIENWRSFSLPQNAGLFNISANFAQGGYLDFDALDLRYAQRLSLSGNAGNLQFYSPPRAAGNGPQTAVRYRISDLPTNEFRLLVRHNPQTQITELIDSGSTSLGNLEFSDLTGSGFKYHLATEAGIRSVSGMGMRTIEIPHQNTAFRIVDLLNLSNTSSADYLIIAPQQFLSQAEELARHKQSIGRFVSPRAVLVDDIFRIFSGGVFSPEAIRNFMVYAQDVWQTAPDYLVLFGTGHYDFKGISFSQPNHIPLYIAANSEYPRLSPRFVSYQIEDFFAYTTAGMIAGRTGMLNNPSTFPQFAVGRIPVNTVQEANAYLQKVKNMGEAQADFSFWRNRHLFVADDDVYPPPRMIETMAHTMQSDTVADIVARADNSADIRKVTLFEFPLDNQGQKPLARQALINEINNGVSLINFFGHGSHSQLAHENIFNRSDINLLTNSKRYFVFLAFSCVVGYFGDPANEGLSELLVRAHRGGVPSGAIATIAAVRISWPNENGNFANAFFRRFYNNAPVSVGNAFIAAKLSQNIPTYAILGDPSHIPMQNRRIIESGNIKILDEERREIDGPLKKMQNIIVRATLPIPNDGVSRRAEIILQNPEETSRSRRDGITLLPGNANWGADVKYRLPGIIATRRSIEFRGNVAEIPLMIPPTIMEEIDGSAIRIHVHSETDNTIFSGAKTENLTFSGFDASNIDINDSIGPVILVQHITSDTPNNVTGDRIVIDGFSGGGEQTIRIRVSDASGVDIYSSQSPGGGISVSIDRAMSRRQFGKDDSEVSLVNDDFREVSLTLPLRRSDFPSSGEYELTISARDILQNTTTRRFILDIRSLGEEQYTIGNFFAYPSPVRMGQRTRFFFNQPTDNVADISLKIYTLNGRLVRSFTNIQSGVEWDLTDQRGQKLSPNVYLYRLFVRRHRRDDGQQPTSSPRTEVIRSNVRKMVIHPPR